MPSALRAVGRNVLRKEGADKVSGRALYIDDLTFPDLLHARTIRSTIPSGEIVDVRFAFETDGFTIVNHRDIAGQNIVALIDEDQPVWRSASSGTSPSRSCCWPTRSRAPACGGRAN